jgi:hypothetical protein
VRLVIGGVSLIRELGLSVIIIPEKRKLEVNNLEERVNERREIQDEEGSVRFTRSSMELSLAR